MYRVNIIPTVARVFRHKSYLIFKITFLFFSSASPNGTRISAPEERVYINLLRSQNILSITSEVLTRLTAVFM